MPGICGIVHTEARDGLDHLIEVMQRGLCQAAWHVGASHVAEPTRCALASARLKHQGPRLHVDRASGSAIVLDGELYDADQVLGASGSGGEAQPQAARLLSAYLGRGTPILKELRGSFGAAIWDAPQQRLVLLTDRFGSRPLYYRLAGGELRFASSIAALLAGDESPRRVNPRGLAQFFTFGHYLRDDTSLEGVRVLPAGACYEFQADSGELSQRTYASLFEPTLPIPTKKDELLDQIDRAFTASVHRCAAGAPHLGISLSGGLDARAILGVIDARQTSLTAVCLGVRGSLDHRSSAQMARLAGCRYHEHVLDASFLGNFRQHLERMVELTDGQYLSQCIVIPTLSVYQELGIQTLLRGHAGELMHMRKAYSYSLDDEALAIRTAEQLRAWLLRRLQAYMLDGVEKPLFRPAYQQSLKSLAEQSLDEDLAEVAHVEQPLSRIWHLFVSQRLRRETVLSMQKFRSVVEPRLPYLDSELVSLLLAASPEMKLGEEIQTHILKKRRPEFLRVTNANTGAPLGASAWRQRLATLQMKVFSKLGLPGYQPYERLGLWLRRELAADVREILLSPETLDGGVYSPDGVRAIVRGHLEEGKNHTFLLMALMIFELGRRRLGTSARQAPAEPILAGSGAGLSR